MRIDIAAIVRDHLRDSVASNKRRAAIRQGRREPQTGGCDHSEWDVYRRWCRDCGITKAELLERRG